MIHLVPAVLHLVQVAAPNAVSPFQWASNYIHVIAWPTICYAAWKVSQAVTKFTGKIDKTTDQINEMASNHFPHMEKYLEEIAVTLRERK